MLGATMGHGLMKNVNKEADSGGFRVQVLDY